MVPPLNVLVVAVVVVGLGWVTMVNNVEPMIAFGLFLLAVRGGLSRGSPRVCPSACSGKGFDFFWIGWKGAGRTWAPTPATEREEEEAAAAVGVCVDEGPFLLLLLFCNSSSSSFGQCGRDNAASFPVFLYTYE